MRVRATPAKILILSVAICTSLLTYGLVQYSLSIQGLSPLQYAGANPQIFIEAELELDLEENRVLSLSDLGIGGYDIASISFDTSKINPNVDHFPIDGDVQFEETLGWITGTEIDHFTESWNGWVLDLAEIESWEVDSQDPRVGNYSLWFTVESSNTSNTWITYGAHNLNLNISEYDKLVLWVKSNTTTEWKHVLGGGTAVIIGSGKWEDQSYFQFDINATTNWQQLVIPVSSFRKVGQPSWNKVDYIIITVHASQGGLDYKFWVDGIGFVKSLDLSIYINGKLIQLTSPAINVSNVWAWWQIYGYSTSELFKKGVYLLKSDAIQKINNVKMKLRLYPESYTYWGHVSSTSWTGTYIDQYEWSKLSAINANLTDARLVASLSKDILHLKVNGEKIDPALYNERQRIISSPGLYLDNVTVIKLAENDEVTFEVHSQGAWFFAPFYFMQHAFAQLQRYEGFNYPMIVICIIIVCILIIRFLGDIQSNNGAKVWKIPSMDESVRALV